MFSLVLYRLLFFRFTVVDFPQHVAVLSVESDEPERQVGTRSMPPFRLPLFVVAGVGSVKLGVSALLCVFVTWMFIQLHFALALRTPRSNSMVPVIFSKCSPLASLRIFLRCMVQSSCVLSWLTCLKTNARPVNVLTMLFGSRRSPRNKCWRWTTFAPTYEAESADQRRYSRSSFRAPSNEPLLSCRLKGAAFDETCPPSSCGE